MGNQYFNIKEQLKSLTPEKFLDKIIEIGKGLDGYKKFPAYTIALRLKTKGQVPTAKQMKAFINCAYQYLSMAVDRASMESNKNWAGELYRQRKEFYKKKGRLK